MGLEVLNDIVKLTKGIYKYRLDNKDLKDNLSETIRNIFYTFYNTLSYYNPDINGITLFFLVPPHLSSPEYQKVLGDPSNLTPYFRYLGVAIPFLAVNFSAPSRQAKIGEYSLRTGGIPTVDEIEVSGDLSVTYIETRDLHVYTFHKLWFQYIEDVSSGIIMPDEKYVVEGNIDYATCAYILKFDLAGNLTYFARCGGIFPSSLSSNELLGQRSDRNLTTLQITYMCPFFNDFTYFELEKQGYTLDNPNGHPFLEDFKSKISKFILTIE